ncbi:MAG: hypothetical protein ACRCTQ_02245 [Brevinemataceae bacterium]
MKKYFFIILYIFGILVSCTSVITDSYRSQLIGTWKSTQLIQTPSGNDNIVFTAVYSLDNSFSLTTFDPIKGTTTIQNFNYQAGYYPPKPAIVLYDIATGNVTGLPIFYNFSEDFSVLTTSTNANMSLSRKWTK